MKKFYFIVSLLLFTIVSRAQITFQKSIGGTAHDLGNSVQQTMDGGYIISGATQNFGVGSGDVYLIRTDTYGDTLWTKTFGGTLNEFGYSVRQTFDGGFIVVGSTVSFGTGSDHVYLIKTDSNGDTLWTKTVGGAGSETAYSIEQTTDGGYIFTGYTGSFGSVSNDVYLVKTDSGGNPLWSKIFRGTNDDAGRYVQQTSDGGYIITGYVTNPITINRDVYLIRTDANGDTLWTKSYGGTGGDEGWCVQQNTDGGFIITGLSASFGTGSADLYLIRTDTIGNVLWTKNMEGVFLNGGYSVDQTSDGGFIVAGKTGSVATGIDVYLVRTNAIGDTLWTKAFGGTNHQYGYAVQQTMDGGYVIAAANAEISGQLNVYLIKTDSLGNSGCNEVTYPTIVTTPPTLVSSPVIIVTSPVSLVTTPPTVSGNGGIVTTFCTTVGLNEATTDNSFTISPNPSSGYFIISFERSIMDGSVEILNILGESVYSENISNASKIEINLKNDAGIYFVRVFNEESNYCKKIIIE